MAVNAIFRGDSDTFTLSVPLTLWSAGGTFYFGLKLKGNLASNDPTDANAPLKKSYNDTFITGTTLTDKVYTLNLTHDDTKDVDPAKYIAEFQWVSADLSTVKTFTQFKYTIKPDLNQRITV